VSVWYVLDPGKQSGSSLATASLGVNWQMG